MELWREMGCTERELQYWLPTALGRFEYVPSPGLVDIALPPGRVLLRYTTLEPRRIALISIARLQIVFRFEQLDRAAVDGFLRHFDLYTRRGGG